MANTTSIKVEDGIAWITMDDGKVNALNAELIGEVSERLNQAERAGAVIVLTGRQGIFSAGFDLATFGRGTKQIVAMVRGRAELILQLLAIPLPVLTVCTGHAYPMGAFLMLAADVRFAVAGDWRIGMNEVAIGITVPTFAVELARHRLTPPGFARITTGAMFAPHEALRYGYVDRVVVPNHLAEAAREEAARLRALDMPSYAATKSRIHERARAAIRSVLSSDIRAISN